MISLFLIFTTRVCKAGFSVEVGRTARWRWRSQKYHAGYAGSRSLLPKMDGWEFSKESARTRRLKIKSHYHLESGYPGLSGFNKELDVTNILKISSTPKKSPTKSSKSWIIQKNASIIWNICHYLKNIRSSVKEEASDLLISAGIRDDRLTGQLIPVLSEKNVTRNVRRWLSPCLAKNARRNFWSKRNRFIV